MRKKMPMGDTRIIIPISEKTRLHSISQPEVSLARCSPSFTSIIAIPTRIEMTTV